MIEAIAGLAALAGLVAVGATIAQVALEPLPATLLRVLPIALAVPAAAWHARSRSQDPGGWALLALALAVAVAALTTTGRDLGGGVDAHIFALAALPLLLIAGTAVLLSRRVRDLPPAVWTDAAAAGAATAALVLTAMNGWRELPGSLAGHPSAIAAAAGAVVLAGVGSAALALAFRSSDRTWWVLTPALWCASGAVLAGLGVADAHDAGTTVAAFARVVQPTALSWPALAAPLLGVGVALAAALDSGSGAGRVDELSRPGAALVASPLAAAVLVAQIVNGDGSVWATGAATVAILIGAVNGLVLQHEARRLVESERKARTDDLTGLANRRYFYERLTDAIDGRHPASRLAVLMIDLDRFKEINDSLGHQVGDEILRMIGPRLNPVVGVWDLLARLGGDEFAVMADGADATYAAAVAERLRESLQQSFPVGDVELHVDASIGIAVWPDDGSTVDELIARADIAMYRAKEERTGVRSYEDQSGGPTAQRLHLLELLRGAVAAPDPAARGLVVHYQPKLSLATGAPVGVEALARFHHPDGTLVFPDLFIAMVENAGLMHEFTLTILRQSMRQCRQWRTRGIRLEVAVNVSTTTLLDLTFPNQVIDILKEEDLPPSALILEITESGFMRDRVRCLDVLHRLRAVGIRISVDDYGTGHSSLSYLRDLPADELKLDRSFVQGVTDDPRTAAIVTSTVNLAHALRLRVVAEGVEDDADLDWLREAGADVIQGFLLSRPLGADELTGWYLDTFADQLAPGFISGPTEAEWRNLQFAEG